MKREEFIEKYAVERKNTRSLKWDFLEQCFGNADLIPMWVADMDFKTCEAIREALKERVEHGVFGYTYISDSYYKAVFDWEETHFGYRPKKEELRLGTGVVPSLYLFVNCFTQPEDAVIILTPVYYPFHECVTNCKRKLVTCDLKYDNGYFSIDFEAFEKAIVENEVKMFLLCSPHNPIGRVWTETELECLLDICRRHNVLVISDEIHQDFVFGNRKHMAAPAVAKGKYADNIVLVNAASKSFNTASLIHANIYIHNPELRRTFDQYRKIHNATTQNIMGLTATEAAYTKGAGWLDGLRSVIQANYDYLKKELNEKVPEITVCSMEGTYLPMLDMRKVIDTADDKIVYLPNGKPVEESLFDFVQNKCELAVDYGSWFGKNAEGFIRLNLATTPENVERTVSNLIRECAKQKEQK